MTEDFNPTEWITTKEAAELTGYTPSYIRKAIGRGRLEAQKIGRDWLLRKEDVLEYAEKMRRLGPAKHDPWTTRAHKLLTAFTNYCTSLVWTTLWDLHELGLNERQVEALHTG